MFKKCTKYLAEQRQLQLGGKGRGPPPRSQSRGRLPVRLLDAEGAISTASALDDPELDSFRNALYENGIDLLSAGEGESYFEVAEC